MLPPIVFIGGRNNRGGFETLKENKTHYFISTTRSL
jgi:hypothetical protein